MTAQEFEASAAEGKKSLSLISDMVTEFANAQNNSYETFTKYKFGKTLYPDFNGRPAQPMKQNAFNALFKSELIRVSLS